MNTLKNQFNQTLKYKGHDMLIDNVNCKAYFKEIKDHSSIDEKYIYCPLGRLKQGSIVNFSNKNYICIQENNNYNGIYDSGIIQSCKYSINFVIGGYVKTFPAIIVSNNQGIASNKYINMSDGVIKIVLQENDTTRQISIDDRLIKMGSAWKITGKTYENEGLLYITANKDQSGVNDDMVNEIPDKNKLHNYAITISNGDTASVNVSSTIQLNCVCTDNGTTITSPIITYTSSDTTIATIDATGVITGVKEGTCTITANFNNVQDTINIIVVSVPVTSYTLKGNTSNDSIIKLSTTSYTTYTAAKLINGVEDASATFTFTILNLTPATTTLPYNFVVIDDTSCKIQCKNYPFTITLRATDKADTSKYIEKIIKLKGVI